MFKTGDHIIYGRTGACVIEDIKTERFAGSPCKYYILRPVYDSNSTVYAPVGRSEEKMKKVLSAKEVYDLINSMNNSTDLWVENDTERKDKFSAILKSGERKELVALVKTLYLKREEQIKSGKKLHIADERIMSDAEKLLYEEFAFVLDIKPDQVVPFIAKQIEVVQKGEK